LLECHLQHIHNIFSHEYGVYVNDLGILYLYVLRDMVCAREIW
jgi:hypothetical protein